MAVLGNDLYQRHERGVRANWIDPPRFATPLTSFALFDLVEQTPLGDGQQPAVEGIIAARLKGIDSLEGAPARYRPGWSDARFEAKSCHLSSLCF